MSRKQTPSQTVGPYFAYGLTAEQYDYPFDQIAAGNLLADCPDIDGTRIIVEGRIFDGEGEPVPDAMIEIWQADPQGRYAHPGDPRASNIGFMGFGRYGTGTEAGSNYRFESVKPGSVDGRQAPHINMIVFARGLLSHLYTRIYFSDDAAAQQADAVLSLVPEARRATLVAALDERDGQRIYRFDVHLQGERETVFFDV